MIVVRKWCVYLLLSLSGRNQACRHTVIGSRVYTPLAPPAKPQPIPEQVATITIYPAGSPSPSAWDTITPYRHRM
jgi:hypothetical protein